MNYSLMPAARVDRLVLQARRAACWLANNAVRLGGDPDRLSAFGHSAGAHLASFLACRGSHEATVALPPVRSVLLVSSLYDLDPIARSFLQPKLPLTSSEIARWSPLWTTPDCSVTWRLIVGSKETQPFHDQAEAFSQRLTSVGASGSITTVPGEDHMTFVRELGRSDTICAEHLSEVIRLSRRE